MRAAACVRRPSNHRTAPVIEWACAWRRAMSVRSGLDAREITARRAGPGWRDNARRRCALKTGPNSGPPAPSNRRRPGPRPVATHTSIAADASNNVKWRMSTPATSIAPRRPSERRGLLARSWTQALRKLSSASRMMSCQTNARATRGTARRLLGVQARLTPVCPVRSARLCGRRQRGDQFSSRRDPELRKCPVLVGSVRRCGWALWSRGGGLGLLGCKVVGCAVRGLRLRCRRWAGSGRATWAATRRGGP